MLDFIKSLFDSKKKEETKEVEVGFEVLDEWIRKEFEKETGKQLREIEDKIEEIKNNLSKFESVAIQEDIEKRLKDVGKTNKDVIIKRLNSFLDNVKVPDGDDINQTFEFLQNQRNKINSIFNDTKKGFMILNKIQEDVSRNLLASLRNLEERLKISNRLKAIKKINKLDSEIRNDKQSKEKIRVELEELNDKIKQKKGELNKLANRKKKLDSSDRKNKLNELKKQLSNIKKQKKKKRNRIIQAISPLSRAFKKMKYGASLPTEDKIIDDYINSPSKALRKDKDMQAISALVEKLKEIMDEGVLDLDQKEKRKLKRDLTSLKSKDLKKMRDEISNLDNEIKKIEEKIRKNDINNQIKNVESLMKNAEKDIENIKNEIEKKENELENLKQHITNKKNQIKEQAKKYLRKELNFT